MSSRGVGTDLKKTEAVSAFTEPKNVVQLRSFLGLAGCYRRFIPNFSSIASPLVELTKKDCKFLWCTPQSEAFHILKSLLCQAPILAYPQLDQPFILQTDASDLGLGAVLTQVDSNGSERVISYASHSLSDRERAYSTTEKEALAVVFGTDHFRPYPLGKKALFIAMQMPFLGFPYLIIQLVPKVRVVIQPWFQVITCSVLRPMIPISRK